MQRNAILNGLKPYAKCLITVAAQTTSNKAALAQTEPASDFFHLPNALFSGAGCLCTRQKKLTLLLQHTPSFAPFQEQQANHYGL